MLPGNATCQRCRKSLVPSAPPVPLSAPEAPAPAAPISLPGASPRPGGVTLIAGLGIAFGALGVLLAIIMLFAATRAHEDSEIMLVLAGAYALLGGLQLAAGLGLWRLKPWGRTFQLALSWIGAFGIPCGTLVSVPVLIYLYKPHVKRLFSPGEAPDNTPP